MKKTISLTSSIIAALCCLSASAEEPNSTIGWEGFQLSTEAMLLIQAIEKPVVIDAKTTNSVSREACTRLMDRGEGCTSGAAIAIEACGILGFDTAVGFIHDGSRVKSKLGYVGYLTALSCRMVAKTGGHGDTP